MRTRIILAASSAAAIALAATAQTQGPVRGPSVNNPASANRNTGGGGSSGGGRGGGTALSRSLQHNMQISGGRSNTAAFQNMVRLNDAIVTGNVAGGSQFRGAVGYTGATDFRSAAGSEDLFSFQRDSYASGLAARGVRGIESLRTQFSLATGAGPNANTAVLQRPATGAAASEFNPGRLTSSQPPADPYSVGSGALRSPARYAAGAATDPLTFDIYDRSGATTRLGVSSLRGMFTENPPGLPLAPTAAQTTPETTPGPEGRISDPSKPDPLSSRIESKPTTYDKMIDEYLAASEERKQQALEKAKEAEKNATPAQPAPELRPPGIEPPAGSPEAVEDAAKREHTAPEAGTFEERLQRMRERLQLNEKNSLPPMSRADLDRAREAKERDATPEEKDARERSDTRGEAGNIGREAKDLFGDHRPRMEKFIDPADDPNAYERAMMTGQDFVNAGRWFDAEESFTRALIVRVGDPVAAAARVHAQLGGGLFLSAAINLRDLLRAHPEMAAVRYDAHLLPREPRLGAIAEALRDAAENRNDTFGRDAGFLLAYLGYQTGSRADIDSGFAAIERVREHLELNRDPLIDVVRAVWAP
jgi:hypothetical protein